MELNTGDVAARDPGDSNPGGSEQEKVNRGALGTGTPEPPTATDKTGERASSFGAKEGKSTHNKVESSAKPRDNMHSKLGTGFTKLANIAARGIVGGLTGVDIGSVFTDKNASKGPTADTAVAGLSEKMKAAGFSRAARVGTTPTGKKDKEVGKLKAKAETKELKNPNTKEKPKEEKKKKKEKKDKLGYMGGGFGAANAYHGTTAGVSSSGYSGGSTTGLGLGRGAQMVERVGGPRKLGK